MVEQAQEFGPTGLRGAMSEIMEEVDKGLIPTVGELSDAIGDSTNRVEQNYQAGKTWRDTLARPRTRRWRPSAHTETSLERWDRR